MSNLFTEQDNQAFYNVAPLAVRMRPRTLDELVGQLDAIGEGTWLRNAIQSDSLSSIIVFGPAGSGKTTLARIIAQMTKADFTEVSAISGGVSDLRRVIERATQALTLQGMRTILFVDEIHRFSRSQQDALLHAVEDRVLVLIGATTENPYFEVNTPLLSRSRIIEFKALNDVDIETVLAQALIDQRGLNNAFSISPKATSAIITLSGGDARAALTTLELAAEVAASQSTTYIDSDQVRDASPSRLLPYDKKGDVHYDIISAFIKSMRGSDPDAAVYWLARMIEGGEDPKFIARRIMIFASEDIGNADPQALLIAHAAFKATESIGYPECQINLSQAAIYMALAPKSNSAVNAISSARAEVAGGPLRAVPNHLRDRRRPGSETYGPYIYPHIDERGYVDQQYLPDGVEKGAFYQPGERGWEAYRSEAVQRDRAEAVQRDRSEAVQRDRAEADSRMQNQEEKPGKSTDEEKPSDSGV
ncbi:MAG: replication-associated recombination protein A [Coriobacteriales bacterium]|jgi:putative ATPase|nr:replication-associated recombination protein A [Coriobacteriales bacterium]